MNTFSRSRLFVDDELKDVIEKGVFDTVDPQIVKQLFALGVISEGTQQRDQFTDLYKQRVYTPFEYEFTIIPTYRCNLSCYYCTRSEKMFSHNLLQKFKEFFSKELEKGDFENVAVRIAGGEPLLHPELLLEMCEELSQITEEHGKKFFSALATNGTLLTDELLSNFSFLNAVQLTFEGCRSYHDSVRYDKTGTYDRVLESAEMVRDAGIFLNMRVHVSEMSIQGLEELFCDLKSTIGVGPASKTMITTAPVVNTRICPLYPSRCTDFTGSLLPKAWEAAHRCGLIITGMPNPPYEVLPCPYVTPTSLIIDPDGILYTCLMGVNEGIGVGSLEQGLESELTRASELWHKECENCKLLPLCGGGCTWRYQNLQGLQPDAPCEVRELLTERLKFYLRNEHSIQE